VVQFSSFLVSYLSAHARSRSLVYEKLVVIQRSEATKDPRCTEAADNRGSFLRFAASG
jgi:hypothetical protein